MEGERKPPDPAGHIEDKGYEGERHEEHEDPQHADKALQGANGWDVPQKPRLFLFASSQLVAFGGLLKVIVGGGFPLNHHLDHS